MTGPEHTAEQSDLPAIDKVVHEPARMAILSVLDAVAQADFTFLETMLGLSKGNLSSHLTRLEVAGLITVKKSFHGRRQRTTVRITAQGRQARDKHWEQLERLHDLMRD